MHCSRAAIWLLVAITLGCQSASTAPGPAVASDAASYWFWALAIDFESREIHHFEPTPSGVDLYYDRTLILSWPEEWTEARIVEWKTALPQLRDDTARDFVRCTGTQVRIDPHRLVTAFPSRPAKSDEVSAFYSLTTEAEPGASGLFCVSDIGYSADRSQALVLVQSVKAGSDNPYQWLMLFEAGAGGWEGSGCIMLPGLQAKLPPHS